MVASKRRHCGTLLTETKWWPSSATNICALMLGADVPTTAVAAELTRDDRRSDAVLWSQQESTALAYAIRASDAVGSRVLVGGPG